MLPNINVIAEICKFKTGVKNSSAPIRHFIDKTLLNSTEEVFVAAVQTAYNDAARTFSGIGGKSVEAKKALAKKIKEYFDSGHPCKNKDDFDELHSKFCEIFISHLNLKGYTSATYGQAQKVVNMTFKYLYCLPDATTTYNEYFEYCHVALDSFTLEWIWRNFDPRSRNLNKYEAWSNINKDNYEDKNKTTRPGYDSIVSLYRAKIPSSLYINCTPFQAEFIFWPEIQMHLATEAFYFALNDNMSNKQKETFKAKDLKSKKAEIRKHPNF